MDYLRISDLHRSERFKYAIFVQGFGSIFEFFAYFKTKNILVSYICHYATDFLLYMGVIFGL